MNPEYYESIVLTTIDKLQKEGRTCGQLTLVKEARLGNVTIIKAIDRLEKKRTAAGEPGPPRNPAPLRDFRPAHRDR